LALLRVGGAAVMPLGVMQECEVCYGPLDIFNVDDPCQSLLCMHVYHVYCLNEIVVTSGSDTLKCPKCSFEQTPPLVAEIKAKAKDMQKDVAHGAPALMEVDGPLLAEEVDTFCAWEALLAVDPELSLAATENPEAPTAAAATPEVPTAAAADVHMGGWVAAGSAPEVALVSKVKPYKGTSKGKGGKRTGAKLRKALAASACAAKMSMAVKPTCAGAPTFPKTTLLCFECNSEVHRDSVRLVSKQKEMYRCKFCRTKITQLYQKFGSWPPPCMAGRSLEEKQTFMKSIHGLSATALADKANMYLKTYDTTEKRYENGGKFYPLAKWQHDGFDSAAIKNLTAKEDTQEHPILGTCYRVKILEKSEAGVQGQTQGDNVGYTQKFGDYQAMVTKFRALEASKMAASTSSGSVVAKAPIAVSPIESPIPETAIAESCSDSSDSSSSSGSSSSKHSKKKKKAKKVAKKAVKKAKKEKKKAAKAAAEAKLAKAEEKKEMFAAMKVEREEALAKAASDSKQAKKEVQMAKQAEREAKKKGNEFKPFERKLTGALLKLMPLTVDPNFIKVPFCLQTEFLQNQQAAHILSESFDKGTYDASTFKADAEKLYAEVAKSTSILKALYLTG
jgi:flagellar biosynthesis GTPase FlhF